MCSGIEPELQDPPKSESMPLGQYPISWSTKCEVPSSPAPGEFRNAPKRPNVWPFTGPALSLAFLQGRHPQRLRVLPDGEHQPRHLCLFGAPCISAKKKHAKRVSPNSGGLSRVTWRSCLVLSESTGCVILIQFGRCDQHLLVFTQTYSNCR